MWEAIASAVAGPLISGLIGAEGQEEANSANAAMSEKQMNFQERMSNTAYQRAVADMKAAGLSPMLAYSQGPASSPGGSTAVMGNKAAAAANSALAAAQVLNTRAQTEKVEAETENVKVDSELKATQMASNLASAGQMSATAERTEVEMRKLEEEIIQVNQLAKRTGWEAKRGELEFSKEAETYASRVSQIHADARRLVAQAQLAGLEIPEAVAYAAFYKSPVGQSKPFVDFGAGSVGNLVNSAVRAQGLRSRSVTGKIGGRK